MPHYGLIHCAYQPVCICPIWLLPQTMQADVHCVGEPRVVSENGCCATVEQTVVLRARVAVHADCSLGSARVFLLKGACHHDAHPSAMPVIG